MPKVSTNINLDSELKRTAQELFSDLGMDFTTAVTIFLKQAVREQGLPFAVKRESPNNVTVEALREYEEMKTNLENYPRYSSFRQALSEVLTDA